MSRETALLLRLMDGTRDLETLARDVGRATGRELSANDVAEALDRTLGPLGLIEGIDRATEAPAGGAERPRAETSRDPGVSHGPALSARLVRRLAAALAPLHAPAIGIPLSAAALALHLLALRSLPALLARERMLLDPAWLVAIALLLPVLLIHELGHASALAYRGGAPGRVGIRRRGPGVVFYADVSDAARLARAGRIGVDLGGLHLQWLACGVLAALHLATGHTLWLEALLVADLNLILNLSPAPGSDGHWLLCDALQTPALGPRALAMLARPRRGSPLPPVRWRLAMLYFVAMALHLALLAAFALGWLLPRLAREWSARR